MNKEIMTEGAVSGDKDLSQRQIQQALDFFV